MVIWLINDNKYWVVKPELDLKLPLSRKINVRIIFFLKYISLDKQLIK